MTYKVHLQCNWCGNHLEGPNLKIPDDWVTKEAINPMDPRNEPIKVHFDKTECADKFEVVQPECIAKGLEEFKKAYYNWLQHCQQRKE